MAPAIGIPIEVQARAVFALAHRVRPDLPGPVLPRLADKGGHLAQRLLLGHVAHAAGVEQHHVRDLLGRRQGIPLRHELRSDGFAVALVHLATVSFNIDARHVSLRAAVGN